MEGTCAIQARELGNRWRFRRISHPGAATWFYQLAVKLGDIQALFFIARYMVFKGHRGLRRMQRMTLESCRAAADTGNPKFLQVWASLHRMLTGSFDESARAFVLAAEGGDRVAQFIVGMDFRKHGIKFSDSAMIDRGYDLLSKAVAGGCVEAMAQFGEYLVDDGHAEVGLRLRLHAMSCGSICAYEILWGSSMPFRFRMWCSVALDDFFHHALLRVLSIGDPVSAKSVAAVFMFEDRDRVLLVRLRRRAFTADLTPPWDRALFGERPWASSRAWRSFAHDLLLAGGGISNHRHFDTQLLFE